MQDTPQEEVDEGAPAWMATFADLMSLLMCFFVLLLSFSEIDLQKYKQVAGSMKDAFGVQRDVTADEIPKAESVVMTEFSPGIPEPTVIDSVRQVTTDDSRSEARPLDPETLEALAQMLEEALATEIRDGSVEILYEDYGIRLRLREKDAFPSASAELQVGFQPVLDKLVGTLNATKGQIIVSGHTDNLPIRNSAYPSNWVLSSARAAAVVHHLAKGRLDDPSRIQIRAFADTRPLAPNDSSQNRARNRRVEIDIAPTE